MVQLVVTPTVDHDEYSSPSITIDLIGNRRLQADVLVAVSRGDEDRHDDIKNLAKGFCRGQDVKLASTFSYEDDDLFFHHVSLKLDRRGAVVRELYAAAVSLHDLCQKFDEAKYSDRALITALLRAGRPDLLVGQHESSNLECKSQNYTLSDPAQKIEFAQDVARFANSEGGGLLVLGLKTKRDEQGDRIVRVSSLTQLPSAARYHRALDQMMVPPVENLTVEALPATPDGPAALVLIEVPPQPEELKPFLVAGAVVRGRVEGAFISIVRRRGEHSVPVSPAAIHAALAAGRALLHEGAVKRTEPSSEKSNKERNSVVDS